MSLVLPFSRWFSHTIATMCSKGSIGNFSLGCWMPCSFQQSWCMYVYFLFPLDLYLLTFCKEIHMPDRAIWELELMVHQHLWQVLIMSPADWAFKNSEVDSMYLTCWQLSLSSWWHQWYLRRHCVLLPTSQVNYRGSDLNISALGTCSTTHVKLRILAFSEEKCSIGLRCRNYWCQSLWGVMVRAAYRTVNSIWP